MTSQGSLLNPTIFTPASLRINTIPFPRRTPSAGSKSPLSLPSDVLQSPRVSHMFSRTSLFTFLCFLFEICCPRVTKGGIMPMPPLPVTLLLVPWVFQLLQSNQCLQHLLQFSLSLPSPLLHPLLRCLEPGWGADFISPLIPLHQYYTLLRPLPCHFISKQCIIK